MTLVQQVSSDAGQAQAALRTPTRLLLPVYTCPHVMELTSSGQVFSS